MSPFLTNVRLVDVLGNASPSGTTVDIDDGHGGQSVHIIKSHSDDSALIAVPICAIVFTFIYLIVKAIMAPFTNRAKHTGYPPGGTAGGGLSDEEVATLMKLQRTLVQMESRVEALETILIEQSRNKEQHGSKL